MTYSPQDFQDEVFSFSLTNDAPALQHSPCSYSSIADQVADDDFLIESPGFGAMASGDDELFALDTELSMLPRSYAGLPSDDKKSTLPTMLPIPDEFANAAQDNYRLWLAGV
ncbi:LAME_0H13982g1_1 [Lachancea meyersii CBS 8951]|uniref:LAME_0H13982g1_1 n=1 Tax=Lachancea meyersii CBS 8951 TaxID=1266667 RepID=A0A1G4KH67_9SACH|nr:LAME_0H13982g1_1 [Lachancea meyersii CBS 8951]